MNSSEGAPAAAPELHLEDLLTNFELFSIFAEFLHENLSHENLTFWVASENFRKHCPADAMERRKQALELYNKYFTVGSRDELNLDEEVRERVRSQLSDPTAQTFAEAQQHITALLHNDCFPKFTRSPFFLRYQQQYALKQAQREEIRLRQSQRLTTSARQLHVPAPPLQHPQTLGDTLHPQVAAVHPPSPGGSRRQQLMYSEGVSSATSVGSSHNQKVPAPAHQYHQVPPLSPSHQYQQVPPLGQASRSQTFVGGSAPAGMSSPSSHVAGGAEKKSYDDPAMSTLMRRVTNAITFGLFKREKEPPLNQLPASRTSHHPHMATVSRRTHQIPNPSASAPSLVPMIPEPGGSATSPSMRTQLQLSNTASPSSSSTGGSPLSGATSRSPRDASPARRDSSSTPPYNNSSGTAEHHSSSHSRTEKREHAADVKKDKKHKKDKKKEKKEKKDKPSTTKKSVSQRHLPPSPRSAILAPRIVSVSAPNTPAISVPHSPHSSSTTASVSGSIMHSPKTPSPATPGSKKSPRSRHSGKHGVELLPSPRPPPAEQLSPTLATVIPPSAAANASAPRPRTCSAGANTGAIASKSAIVRSSGGSFSSPADRDSVSMTQSAVLPASVAKEVLAEIAEIQVSAVCTIPASHLSQSGHAASVPRSHSPQGGRAYSPQLGTQGAAVTSTSTESISLLSSRSPRAQPPIPPTAVPEGKPTASSRLERVVPLLDSPLPTATPPTPPAPVSAVAADLRPLDLNPLAVAPPLSPSASGSSSSKRAKDNTTAVRQSNSSSSSPRDNNKQRIEGSRISIPATSAGGGTGSRSNSMADAVSPRARDLSNASNSQGSSPVHSPGRDSRSSTSSSKARSLSNSTGQSLAALSGKPITRTGSKPHLSHLTHSNSSSRDRDSGVLLRTVTSDL